MRLPRAKRNPAFGQIVRREFYFDAITGDQPDVVFAHLSGYVCGDHVAIVEFDSEHRIGKGIHDGPFHFDLFFLRHTLRAFQKASRILPQALTKGKTTRLKTIAPNDS